ncbi:hypothetical protein [Chryseobacterium sp.]|uniref:hypothetical protein n=1 Tax=Chryseobacterium sp. TaxID=1871047 RepID=UPI0024E25D5E|nr:hypothetical protein [Chryseobacterium sp.]
MKTKLIIIGAIAAALLYSCTDREDDVNVNETVKKSNQENFKLNKPGGAPMESIESSIKSDSTRVFESSGTVPPVIPGSEDGGDPKDVPVPPRR